MMFDLVFKWAKLLAVLCVVPVTIFLCFFLHSLTVAADAVTTTMNTLPAKIDDRIGKLQTDVMNKIDTVQDKMNVEINTLAAKADARIDTLTAVTDNRIGSVQKDLMVAVGDIRKDMNSQLTTANGSVTTLVTAYADVPKVVGAQYEKDWSSFFDCGKNKLCLQGQASDTMFAVRQSSRDTSTMMTGFSQTMPKMEEHMLTISNTFARDIPIMTTNIAGITQNINTLTKPKWYDRIIGYALNGMVIYRSINPGTNVAITAATAIAK